MNAAWEYTINTGNPDIDRQTVEAYRQSAAASGMTLDVQPLPTGGFHVRMSHPSAAGQQQQQQAPQNAWQQQQPSPQQQWQQQQAAVQQQGYAQMQQPQGTGQPYGQAQQQWQQQQAAAAQPPQQQQNASMQAQMAFAGAGAGGGAVGGAMEGVQAPSLSQERIKYLRKVYGLLTATVFLAIASGWAALNLGGTEKWTAEDGSKKVAIEVPSIVAAMLDNPVLLYGAFGVLFVVTLIAGWTSRVKGLNVAMLFLVGVIMGVELAPMIYVAQVFSGMGDTLSANPVRDAGIMTGAVFAGITAYVFITKKDFSYMKGMLVMGSLIIFCACLMTFVFQSEMFALAVASVGALLSAGWLLYMTSYITRKSRMDDPVGDALVFVVQLRNLFMFILRILMSSRR
jgi:FtsH-binding integral membrane protein